MSIKSSYDRRIEQIWKRAVARCDAAMWRHLKQTQQEIAALESAKVEIQRLRSLQTKRKTTKSPQDS